MSLDFTAIDFETANAYRGSPCSVGLVKVRDGDVIDRAHWLMRPPVEYDWFAKFHMALHGITPAMVSRAPRWRQMLPQLMGFIGNDVVVAHNAAFDLGVVRYACIADGLHWPTLDFLCTLVVSHRTYDLASYRLPFVAQAAGATLGVHHNAADDALAAAQITVAMAHRYEVDNIPKLGEATRVRLGHMETGFYMASRWKRPSHGLPSHGLTVPDVNMDADPDGPLFEKTVAFTGGLVSMTRQVAWEEVAKAGGIPKSGVTKNTQVLVAGDINPLVLSPGMTMTSKAAKAFVLKDAGQDIELLTEDDFLRALEPDGKDKFDITELEGDVPRVVDESPDDCPFYAPLNHPRGRAVDGEPCVKCGEPVPGTTHWIYRDRHVCSSRCNENLKRQYKRHVARLGEPGSFHPRLVA